MKYKLAIFVALLALVYTRDYCRVYSCGTVDDSDDLEYWAQRDNNDFGNWNVQQCVGENMFCKTFASKAPGALQYPARCEEIKPEVYQKTFTASLGTGVDGDYCESYKDCHRSYYSKGVCQDNVCKVPTREGSKCKVNIDCPMEHFCNSKSRWTEARKAGQNCTKEIECETGHSCLRLVEHDKDENICIPHNYLDDGVLFAFADTGYFGEEKTDLLEAKQLKPIFSPYCESINHVQLGKNLFQCRKADTNLNSDLSRKSKGNNCIIQTYTNEDPQKYDVLINKTERSLCGFNKDNRAWCPLKAGDKMAQYFYFNWVDRMNSFKCSRFTQNDPESGSICHDYYVAMQNKDEDLFSYYKFQATVVNEDSAQVWANTANNNKCVAQSLTLDFWNGHYATFEEYTYSK